MVHMRSMREMIPTNSFDKIFFETAISILTNNNNPILQKKKKMLKFYLASVSRFSNEWTSTRPSENR